MTAPAVVVASPIVWIDLTGRIPVAHTVTGHNPLTLACPATADTDLLMPAARARKEHRARFCRTCTTHRKDTTAR